MKVVKSFENNSKVLDPMLNLERDRTKGPCDEIYTREKDEISSIINRID